MRRRPRGKLIRMSSTDDNARTTLPYLTSDHPGVGGVIKQYDEDFVVEEMPLYEACGEGTHVYFTIEKRGLPTLGAIRIIARELGKQPREIGYAGLKDAHGVTRQRLSVEHVDPDRVANLALSRIAVVSVERHTNKLKLGHLAGNRFEIKIRATASDPLQAAQVILDVLAKRGCPNYFGPQRFGKRGDNADVGKAVMTDDLAEAVALILGRPGPADGGEVRTARELFDAGDLRTAADTWPRRFDMQARMCHALIKSDGNPVAAWRAVDHSLRKLYFSAVQSEVFNRALAARINAIDRLADGDLAWKHKNGACFAVEDAAVEQPRCDAFEISPTGPLFGRKMTDPTGEPARIEAEALAGCSLEKAQLRAKDGAKLDGARRPLRVPVTDPNVSTGSDDRGPFLCVTFALPPGAYATNVTREICKANPP